MDFTIADPNLPPLTLDPRQSHPPVNPPQEEYVPLQPTQINSNKPEVPSQNQENQHPQSQVDLSAMKEKITRLMRMENLADITLAGYMIKLFRQKNKMSFRDLHDEVSKCYDTLRRSDGSKYTGDLAKALKGCLTSSEIFKEVGDNVWSIREKEAKMYEDKTTKKLKTLINKKKGRSGRKKGGAQDEEAESDDDGSESGEDSDDSMEVDKSAPVKKVKPSEGKYDRMYNMLEVYARDIKANESTASLIQNPLEMFGENDTTQEALKKIGHERFLGIVECFQYFSPMIQEHLKENSLGNEPDKGGSKPGRKPKAAATKANGDNAKASKGKKTI